MRVFMIGRDNGVDIRVDHHSVSRFHAELVVTDDGRLYFVDRASTNGSFRGGDNGGWVRFEQGFIEEDELIRVGSREVRLSAARFADIGVGEKDIGGSGSGAVADNLPSGLVERDPITGKIIDIGYE